ncbi:MAG TPA: permease prefix domain 1-containing protein [Gammaproteobacteria bacterium]
MDGKRPGEPAVECVEKQIDSWRAHLRKSRAISGSDAEELEDHLREQIAALGAGGLADDEAFLVAVKRLGAIDALTREFAREHSDRLWKQLVLAGDGWAGAADMPAIDASRKLWVALALAVAAGIAIKVPALFGIGFVDRAPFYALNLGFFTLPFMVAYFAWERPLPRSTRWWLAAVFVLAAIVVNAFPFSPSPGADTEFLTILHLPIALWLAVGVAYVGGRWPGSDRRMDFVRFTGELFIYYVLIALGGGVLIGLTFGLFQAIGIDVQRQVQGWILPCGVAGAAVVAMWLVEAKQSVIENMAPVLTRIFAPLFALVLLAFVATMVWTGRGIDVEREVLIAFDLLLVVVFGLLLYSVSARDPSAPPSLLDWIQLTLVGSALVVDVVALWAIGSRISDFGFTPNRVAALGENLVLLVNLAGSLILYARFVRGGVAFARLCAWQTFYLYVLAAWAAVVAFLFPPLFGFA